MNKFIKTLQPRYKILLAFFSFEIFNLFILSYIHLSHPEVVPFSFDNSFGFLRLLGNFDGFHYWHIAREGYGLYQQAFFPLYPIIIRFFAMPTHAYFLTGLLISNGSLLISLYLLFKVFRNVIGEANAWWLLLFILGFPTSFFFMAYYSESLFLLLFSCSLYLLQKGKYIESSIPAYLLGLTRLVGIFSPASYFIFLFRSRLTIKKLILLSAPILGFFTYSFYLFNTKGDFLYFFSAQPNFGANRSSHLVLLPQVIYRYIKIFETFKWDLTYFVAILEFGTFICLILILLWQIYSLLNRKRDEVISLLLGINLFSLLNLMLPTLSGTLSSIPRYALLSIGFFVVIATQKNLFLKFAVFITFVLLHVILFSMFLQNKFIG